MILQNAIETILATGKISFRELQMLQTAMLDGTNCDRLQTERIRTIHDRLNRGFIQVAC
ncbi:MAG: hypothetical protein J7647_03300 [Cyanobacteria bacterium SBLK]|nr:hypothetical protein [Cyanobacteria bacterium SBLK]